MSLSLLIEGFARPIELVDILIFVAVAVFLSFCGFDVGEAISLLVAIIVVGLSLLDRDALFM
ncbi:hypothetical protein, partial [Enterococcus faecium]|uniref:hypothetical protein n=1 Tax=Enterococcus faecium TaxID=1352 RepID=UPI0030C8029C